MLIGVALRIATGFRFVELDDGEFLRTLFEERGGKQRGEPTRAPR